eukprot:14465937-Alexandrium_andersonii.AAC.1
MTFYHVQIRSVDCGQKGLPPCEFVCSGLRMCLWKRTRPNPTIAKVHGAQGQDLQTIGVYAPALVVGHSRHA